MDKFSYEYYEGLPFDYEEFLIEKYKSFISNCRYIEIYFPNDKHYFAILKKEDKISEIIVFGILDKNCNCYNSLVNIDQAILKEFSNNVFSKFTALSNIRFSSSYLKYDLKKSFLLSTANDYILNLPDSLDTYFAELGATTRRHLKNYKARLLRDYPQAHFVTKYTSQIEREEIDRIVQLSFQRMKSKGIIPGKNQNDVNDFYRYSQYYGLVGYIEIDGQIVAGSISYIIDNRFFLYMIAHDNDFAKFNIGQLCIVYLIQLAIGKKFKTFHFLWGENDYKMRFNATPHQLSTYVFYKTYSIDFMLSKAKARFSRFLIQVRLSKYSKPVRNAIKFYRRSNLSFKLDKDALIDSKTT